MDHRRAAGAAQLHLNVLIVEGDVQARQALGGTVQAAGHVVFSCCSLAEALREAVLRPIDLAFLDEQLDAAKGAELSRLLLGFSPWAKTVIMLSDPSLVGTALGRGAADVLRKPFTPIQAGLLIRNLAEQIRLERKVSDLQLTVNEEHDSELLTVSPLMEEALSMARRVACSRTAILICGERGTGREQLARTIHAWSNRAGGRCVAVSCHTDAPNTLEEELFGTVAAAGSARAPEKLGWIALCQGGTLILNEINALPPALQPRLERLLTEHQYEWRADFSSRVADVRVIATSSCDLREQVELGRFREQLFAALDVVRIEVPPLRKCPGDVRLLAETFLSRFERKYHQTFGGFSPDVLRALEQHDWPGNRLALQNVVERLALLSASERIDVHTVSRTLGNARELSSCTPGEFVPLETIEDMHVRRVVEATGTIKQAAAILGMNYSTLWRRLRRNRSSNRDTREAI